MKFVFAPDSFKGSLSAVDMTKMMDDVCKRHFPQVQTVLAPVADGGEGTVEALVLANGGHVETVRVTGPDGNLVEAAYGMIDDGQTAVLEMAQASGLPLMRGKLDPLGASTRGTGEMIMHALDRGVKHIVIGIGGSATNDGGMGMLAALGARFFDKNENLLYGRGQDLYKVQRADFSNLHPRLHTTDMTVICDVTNPLYGPNGATAIYGPQKGVTDALFGALEGGMVHYSGILERTLGYSISQFPGAGAAGGLGAALGGVLKAHMRKGIDAVLEAMHFDELLNGCDLVITGEGKLDAQSVLFGKAPAGIAKRCAVKGIPVIAVVGGMGDGAQAFYQEGLTSIITAINGIMPLDHAIANAKALFEDSLERLFRLIKIGMSMHESGS